MSAESGTPCRRPCSAEEPVVGWRDFRDTAGDVPPPEKQEVSWNGYSYSHLCETVRTARGPRQRVVASLGKLDESEAAGLRDGWDELPALLRGEAPGPRATTTELPGIVAKETTAPRSAPQWEQADVRGLRVERTRDFGESYPRFSDFARPNLGLRPVFHQKEDRVQAHILVCFLALALWRSLEQAGARSCACASSPRPSRRPRNCSPTAGCGSRKALAPSQM